MTEEATPNMHEILVTPALDEPLHQMIELGGPGKVSLVVHIRPGGTLSVHLAGVVIESEEELSEALVDIGEGLAETFSRGEGHLLEDGFEK